MSQESVTFSRECNATAIPQGNRVTIPAGAQGVIIQALGDTFTVQVHTPSGLYRIDGGEADAIGKVPPVPTTGSPEPAESSEGTEGAVWAALKNVYDPEIPVNIVDLGLIYDLKVEAAPTGGSRVYIQMTLTAQGCGMGPAIAMDAKNRVEQLPGVSEADVQVVWDPPWTPRMISPEGRAKLGLD